MCCIDWPMFKIKICGITTVDDALVAAEAGADAIGLNFYEKSPRFASDAGRICEQVPAGVLRVGVFVNASVNGLVERLSAVQLDAVQLHGDEPPEFLSELALSPAWNHLPVVRALRCPAGSLEAACRHMAAYERLDRQPAAVLIDAYHPNSYGGTGIAGDWRTLGKRGELLSGRPLILAGGLTPANVAEAITIARPDGVDVSSGVEASPGRKDAGKVRAFIAAAKKAFARLDNH